MSEVVPSEQLPTGEPFSALVTGPTQPIAELVPATRVARSAAIPTTVRRRPTLALLLKFKWLGIAVFGGLFIPAAVIVWFTNLPVYEAHASVEVLPMIPRIVYRTDDNGLIPLYQQFLNNQALVLRSPTVLARVLDSPDVRETTWYKRPTAPFLGSPPSPLERLREDLAAQVRARTSFVDVRILTRQPADAALIVNAVVDEYLKYVREQAQKFDDDVYQALTQEHNALRATIDGLKSVIAELRGDLLTATPEELQAQQRRRLDFKSAQLGDLRQEIAVSEWQLAKLEQMAAQAQPGTEPNSSELPPLYLMDPEWRRLYMELKTAEHQLQTKRESLGDSHHRVTELRMAVDHAQDNLSVREAQIDDLARSRPASLDGPGQSLAQDIEHHKLRLDRLKYEENLRTQDVEQERERVERTSGTAGMLAKELDDLRYAEERFRDVRQRKIAMEIERRAPASIRVQDRAFPPTQPANATRRRVMLLLVLAGALGSGLVAMYVRASTNPEVQDLGDLSLPVPAPFLGQLPLARRGRNGHDESLQAECIRMVRTALLQRLEQGRGCTVQLTSAGAGAGKTSITLLLAESLARCDKRVLVVDADLRRPTLHERCNVARAPGFVEVLSGAADDRAIVRCERGGFDLLPCGRHAPELAELLSGGALDAQLARWRSRYDLVLLDSAPVLPVADARILARRVDGNVVVTREAHCRRADVLQTLAHISAAGGLLLGIVLFSRGSGARYYGGSYGYGYTPSGSGLDAREVG